MVQTFCLSERGSRSESEEEVDQKGVKLTLPVSFLLVNVLGDVITDETKSMRNTLANKTLAAGAWKGCWCAVRWQ